MRHTGFPNDLLASLASEDFERLRPFLKPAELVYETVLFEAGAEIDRVIFPHSGVVSLVVSLADGGMIEAAMVGRDGVVGASCALDGNISVSRAIVQQPGMASVIDVGRLRLRR